MDDVLNMLERIRETKPLVYHITNHVTSYYCAAATRAFGALPVMSDAIEEAEEMAAISSSLVLNIGTLTPGLIDAMITSGRAANKKGIPITFDVVGAGATTFRTREALRILSCIKPSVIKGNCGELAAIAGIRSEVRGVESVSASAPPYEICKVLSAKYGCAAVITGKRDICASETATYAVENGHPLMGKVVGTGCMAASAIGTFCAVEKDSAKAAANALACYGVAGELAADKAGGPGSFLAMLIDEIHNLEGPKIKRRIRVHKT